MKIERFEDSLVFVVDAKKGYCVNINIVHDAEIKARDSFTREIYEENQIIATLGEHPHGAFLNRGCVKKGYEDFLVKLANDFGSLAGLYASLPVAFSTFTGYIPREQRKKKGVR